MKKLPKHLRKYIVKQDYRRYTPIDQACWRYILRQLKSYLSQHAHACYTDGLSKTGIDVEEIPRIEKISKKISRFGWRALPVSGFIPPAAFMELQALGVLPIACAMRSLDHLSYTPAPDIVHEAAGHAPILVNTEFSDYLRQYASVARKAIISREDLDLYEAIRVLSDVKENPSSTQVQIDEAQKRLEQVVKKMSHVSEASLLSRMNWWTAEYGLIGDISRPRIFGAGLLSSVGESRQCLSDEVRKIPLTVDCIQFGYDITEPQPQLFVSPDFETLGRVLEQMSNQMAFRQGGESGLKKAIQAETVNTVELNSGLQISGKLVKSLEGGAYLQFEGPCQLSHRERQLPGHSHTYHSSGFGMPVGFFNIQPKLCLSLISDKAMAASGLILGNKVRLETTEGIVVEGRLVKTLRREGKLLVLSFEECLVVHRPNDRQNDQRNGRQNETVLFDPSWGRFDMAVGSSVVSVFGGPADRESYGEAADDFVAVRVPSKVKTRAEIKLQKEYAQARVLRSKKMRQKKLEEQGLRFLKTHPVFDKNNWLLALEMYELFQVNGMAGRTARVILKKLQELAAAEPRLKTLIDDGLKLACVHL